MSDDKARPEKDDKTGRFLPGNSGFGGRPKGARSKLGEAFIEDMLNAWEAQGPVAIQRVIEEKPDAFLKVVASILPKDLNINVNQTSEMSDEQLLERIRKLDATIQPFLATVGESGTSSGAGKKTAH